MSRTPQGRLIARVAAVWIAGLFASAGAEAPEIPASGAALADWLKAGHYRAWRGEGALHDSAGPHFGKVRAYLNPALFDSMQAGSKLHPKGAVAVKELYGGGERVLGWSVAVKLEDASAGGGNWYWYEKFEDRTVADARGVLLCRACHLTGRDYVLTPWPLR